MFIKNPYVIKKLLIINLVNTFIWDLIKFTILVYNYVEKCTITNNISHKSNQTISKGMQTLILSVLTF